MAVPIETLKLMDDGHAIAVLRSEIDELTSTPLEIFLLGRLESLIEDGSGPVQEAADECELDAADIEKLGDALIESAANSAALLSALGDAGIDSPDAIAELIEFRNTFVAVANDGADAFTRLNDLINQAQE